MKLRIVGFAILAILCLCSATCIVSEVGGSLTCVAHHSTPTYHLMKNGTLDYTNFNSPLKGGEDIANASIVVNNTTKATSVTLQYWQTAEYNKVYLPLPMTQYPQYPQEFAASGGDTISVQLTALEKTYTGSAVTPDSTIAFNSPASNADVSQPFTITWSRVAGAGGYTATHAIVILRPPSSGSPVAYPWSVVAFDSNGNGSYAVSGQAVANGYSVKIIPMNIMNLTSGDSVVNTYLTTATMYTNTRYFDIIQ